MTEGNHESQENLVDVSDGKWIPRDRFDQVSGQVSQLRAEVEGLKKTPEQTATMPSYSELVNQVDSGDITQAEADEVNASRIRKEVVSELSDVMFESRAEDKNQAILADYISLVPELNDEESEINNRVVNEFQTLQTLGLPADTTTQVTAVRSVLGAPELLRKRVEGQKILNTHEETGGSGGDDNEKSDWDKLPARNKAFYERALRNGGYKDQDECVAEAKAAGIIS